MNLIKKYRQETNRPPMVTVLKGSEIKTEFQYYSEDYVKWLEKGTSFIEDKTPARLQAFMNAAMREFKRENFIEAMGLWAINQNEFQEIKEWFEKHGIDI